MQSYHDNLILQFDDQATGNAASGQLVTVFDAGLATKPSIFDVLGSPIANPLTTDIKGNFSFTIADGVYDIVGRAGTPDETRRDQVQIAVPSAAIIPRLNPATLAIAIADPTLQVDDVLHVKERSTGNGGGAIWDVFPAGTFTVGALIFDVFDHDTLPLQLKLRISNERPDVAEFGSIGDGTTENAAIFTQLETLSFSDVYVPDGTYKVTGVTLTKKYRGPGIIVLDGKAQINDKDFVFVDPSSARNIIQFDDLNGVKVRAKHYPMGGFRFMGQYKKSIVPVFSIAGFVAETSVLNDLAFGMTSDVKENWYGVFACANQGDAVPTFRIVPFLRVDSVASLVVTLRKAGEAIHASAPQTYTWAVNALAGVDCLVITEGVDGRFVAFSGRQTTITANTTTTVTIGTIGNISNQDWLLPAPNDEFEFYRYCGAFYMDTEEVRNIADSGTIVKSRGIFDQSGTNTGAVGPTPEKRQPSGYISPLASGVYLLSTGSLPTASLGRIVEDFWTDTSHNVTNGDRPKEATATVNYNMGEMYIPFSFGPQYYYSNEGTLDAARTNGQQNLWGWIEP